MKASWILSYVDCAYNVCLHTASRLHLILQHENLSCPTQNFIPWILLLARVLTKHYWTTVEKKLDWYCTLFSISNQLQLILQIFFIYFKYILILLQIIKLFQNCFLKNKVIPVIWQVLCTKWLPGGKHRSDFNALCK